jgi:ABC-type polysaccharide/polyol phosphate export permease
MFPAEILPIVTVLSNLVHFLFGLIILVGFLIYFKAPLQGSELVWFPVVVLVQLILTLGFALILSALTVHFRDIKDILANVMTLWFFVTPIIYSWQNPPQQVRRFLDLNPFTHLAISYQEILYFDGPFGHVKWLLALGVMSVGLFLFGYFLFDRLRDSFAEEV